MREAAPETGITLAELLVAVVAASLILAGGYRLFLHFQKQSLVQRRIAQAQAQLFPAQASLEKNLRRAGQGIPRISVRRLSASARDTLGALRIGANASGADTLIVRGNFDALVSQLVSPAPSPSADAGLSLLSGTAGRFAAGDLVVLAANGLDEYARVTGVDAAADRIRTEARLHPYSAGATVTRVSSYRYFVAPDSSLRLAGPQGTSTLLDRYVTGLRFALVDFNGNVDSAAPWIPANLVQSVTYALTLRVPKSAGARFERTVKGRILLRN